MMTLEEAELAGQLAAALTRLEALRSRVRAHISDTEDEQIGIEFTKGDDDSGELFGQALWLHPEWAIECLTWLRRRLVEELAALGVTTDAAEDAELRSDG